MVRRCVMRDGRSVFAAALLLLVACDRGSAPSSTPLASPIVGGKPPSFSLGGGEPRKPELFTVQQRLLDAVSRGDRTTIERALARGATVATKDDLGRSLVVLAALDANDLDLVRWLHAKGAALDEPDVGGRTALSFAASNGRLDMVTYLVDNGATVDRTDAQDRTALFHAALGDHPDVVVFLLDRGANPNARDQFGDTPLIVACAKGFDDTAALLLRRGADPALTDQEGRTARERAATGTAACQ